MKSCPATFTDTAPFGWTFDIPSARSPAETFALIVDPDLEAEWFPKFHSCCWEGRAGGVGARRIYRLTYARLVEEVTAWRVGEHFQFWLSSSTLRFLEDYRLTALPDGRCTIRWKICYEPRTIWRPLHPVLRPLFERDFSAAAQGLQSVLA